MNEVLKVISMHKSIRKFKNIPLPQEDYTALLNVVKSIPTSINGQNFSIIIVENKEQRKKMVELTGNQPYVATASLFLVIVVDFYRSHIAHQMYQKEQIIQESVESLLVGAVDSGILLGQLIIAAESLGLGTVPIGAIRQNIESIVEILKLPSYTFPIVGLCIGIPEEKNTSTDIKPRLPKDITIFTDAYHVGIQEQHIKEYDMHLQKYHQIHYGTDTTWSDTILKYYSKIYYPTILTALNKQGFSVDK